MQFSKFKNANSHKFRFMNALVNRHVKKKLFQTEKFKVCEKIKYRSFT